MTSHLTLPFRITVPHDKKTSSAASTAKLGEMPEWDLSDLYAGPDSAELKSDLDALDKETGAFQDRFQGALSTLAQKGGGELAASVRTYEALSDRLGRVGSYAGLLYAADTSDPERAKFYGDIQEKLTAITTKLLFYPLEFNRLDDGVLEAALKDKELAHYAPWIDDLRKEKPFQLSDEIEKLFHEKSISGRGAWNRLFNETMTALRFDVDGEELSLEPTLNRLTDADGAKRREAAEALSGVLGENLRLFTHITNTLAKDKEISDRWRGFEDVADSRHLANRVEREVVDALEEAVRDAYPRISHRYYALKARWMGQDKLAHWDRNAPLADEPQRVIAWSQGRITLRGSMICAKKNPFSFPTRSRSCSTKNPYPGAARGTACSMKP